jgi:hypothetical protein
LGDLAGPAKGWSTCFPFGLFSWVLCFEVVTAAFFFFFSLASSKATVCGLAMQISGRVFASYVQSSALQKEKQNTNAIV